MNKEQYMDTVVEGFLRLGTVLVVYPLFVLMFPLWLIGRLCCKWSKENAHE